MRRQYHGALRFLVVTLGLVKSGIVIEKRAGVGIRQLSRDALTRSEKTHDAAKFLIELGKFIVRHGNAEKCGCVGGRTKDGRQIDRRFLYGISFRSSNRSNESR